MWQTWADKFEKENESVKEDLNSIKKALELFGNTVIEKVTKKELQNLQADFETEKINFTTQHQTNQGEIKSLRYNVEKLKVENDRLLTTLTNRIKKSEIESAEREATQKWNSLRYAKSDQKFREFLLSDNFGSLNPPDFELDFLTKLKTIEEIIKNPPKELGLFSDLVLYHFTSSAEIELARVFVKFIYLIYTIIPKIKQLYDLSKIKKEDLIDDDFFRKSKLKAEIGQFKKRQPDETFPFTAYEEYLEFEQDNQYYSGWMGSYRYILTTKLKNPSADHKVFYEIHRALSLSMQTGKVDLQKELNTPVQWNLDNPETIIHIMINVEKTMKMWDLIASFGK
jgi:hypothetical protein